MVAHIRKLLYDDSSSSPPLISPPPPSFVYNGPKQYNDFSPYLIPLFFALGAAFLIVAYFTFVKKYYLSPNNQRRTASQNLDENHGPAIDHPIWLINTVGLEQSVIDSIPVFKYEKNEGLIEGTMCSICLTEFVAEETLRLLPKCSHAFHMVCIDTWLSSHKNCPTCRAPIVRESAVTIQIDDSGSNPNNLTPLEEAPDANIRNFGEVECYQRGGENEEIIAKKSPSLGYGFRVFSDLGGYREKVNAEQEQVRRSISMDLSSASSVYCAMSNIHESEVERAELLQASDEKAEKSEEGVNGSSRISKIMKSSSLRFSLRKGPISMKRSSSSGGN